MLQISLDPLGLLFNKCFANVKVSACTSEKSTLLLLKSRFKYIELQNWPQVFSYWEGSIRTEVCWGKMQTAALGGILDEALRYKDRIMKKVKLCK